MTSQQAGLEAELASRREDWPEWRRLMEIARKTGEPTALEERVKELEKLLRAVKSGEFGGVCCEDVENENWFDRRERLLSS